MKIRRYIRVTYDNGEAHTTEINGTPDEIRAYYLEHYFNLGAENDRMAKSVLVEFVHPCGHACEHAPALGALVCPCSSGECKA